MTSPGDENVPDLGSEPHELWDEPREGLPEDEEAWTWDEEGFAETVERKIRQIERESGGAGTLSITSRLARRLRLVPTKTLRLASGSIHIPLQA
jgi:hypothetical protein